MNLTTTKKQGFYFDSQIKSFEKYQKKLQTMTEKHGFYGKTEFQNLEKNLQAINLKKDFFGNYVHEAIQTIIDQLYFISVEILIIPLVKPLTYRFVTIYHEAGHAIMDLFSQYWEFKSIKIHPTGGGYCSYISKTKGTLKPQQKITKIKELMASSYGGLVAEEWLQKQYHQIKPQASTGDLNLVKNGALQLLYYREFKKFKVKIRVKDFKIRFWKQLTQDQKEYIEQVEKEAYQKAVEIIKEKEFLLNMIYEIYIQNNKPSLTKAKLLKELAKHNITIE
ncbi:hypothetical protein [Candidatus Phytoplasma pruni]|uniref:Peptidase M41 domain-containing protein n=1 Tax=Candidatus Phytoplasma pruni TaxID=479893 RepID=A0A851HAE3_9MOLU|nr:hypothetical protein [Candidatus Phytoplasma pruni]NWN45922.1 hypothetical protein [Candidatus Phytoplasma pruni]